MPDSCQPSRRDGHRDLARPTHPRKVVIELSTHTITPERYYDPVDGTYVVFDDEVAVEIPDTIDPYTLKARIGHYEKAGLSPEDLGVHVHVLGSGVHPRFAGTAPTKAANDWVWLSTLGAVGNAGPDAEEFTALVHASIDFDAPAKAL